ncbi:glycosyltransferase [uncultured Tateyamaria sp.]|uniref:glycosyltransferase n=1 Tax=uncultured Tateyamaria sp. TaxID=455651 RepID=UPI00262DBEBF|nr:glycosyltransferase [uncultured Tateyamaria sp.]
MSQSSAVSARKTAPRTPEHVRIVMATRNGAAYLSQQLQSIVDQTHKNWSLFVGDDGSDDDTCAQIRAFAAAHPDRDVTLVSGPCQGSAANFLTQAAAAWRDADWLAFADQDDVWMPTKLERALSRIGRGDTAAGYSSRSIHTAPDLTPLRTSSLHRRAPGFANALVQNVLSGHALVLNPAAAALVVNHTQAALASKVPFHDWWIYNLIAGAGGRVVLDPEPGLYYRLHGENVLGHNRSWSERMVRLRILAGREFAGWIDCNLAALAQCEAALTPDARALVKGMVEMRAEPRGRVRLRALRELGLYRQSAGGDRVLRMLALTGRL